MVVLASVCYLMTLLRLILGRHEADSAMWVQREREALFLCC